MQASKHQSSNSHRQFSILSYPAIEVLESRQLLSASPTLWADDAQGRLFTVTPATGQVHVVGTMPAVMYDIAFDASGNLYGVDAAGGTSHLWKINAYNATAKQIGAVGTFVNSLVFSTSGKLFAAGSALYSINTATGHGTQIGTSNLSGYSSGGDLAFDSSGNLFLSTTNNSLVRVNSTSGAATLVGPIGFNEVYGMAFGPDGVLYGMSDATSQIFSIDRTTGHCTLLSSFANIGVSGVNGSTFPTEAQQRIEVDGSALKITDGDTTPSLADGTNFGSAAVGTTVPRTFTLVNDTTSSLNLTSNPRVTISGTNAGDFTLISAPASPIAPGASTTFKVKFTPHGTGARSAVLTINNSNASHPHYRFAIAGTSVIPVTIYGADSTGNLFTVNSATGQTHTIGHMSTVMFDIAFDHSGNLYGIDSQNGLWHINSTTAAISEIGVIGVNDNINSLTFGPDGNLYAAGHDLYKILLSSSVFFDEGTLGGYWSAGDLAFDKAGDLVMSTTTNQLVKINPSTAQTTLLGPIGFQQVLGLAEGPDGVLYGMSDTTDQIFSIDPITGKGSSPVTFTGVNGIYGAAVKP